MSNDQEPRPRRRVGVVVAILAVIAVVVAVALVVTTVVRQHPGQTPSSGGVSRTPVAPGTSSGTAAAGTVTSLEGYRIGEDISLWGTNLDLLVRFDDGTLSVDTKRCLIDGVGQYTMSPDGAWTFSPGPLSQAVCPGDLAGEDYKRLIDTLSGATTWAKVTDPNMMGTFYAFTGGETTIYLRLPDDQFPDMTRVFGTLAPQPLPDASQQPGWIDGTWHITGLNLDGGELTNVSYIDWDVVIADGRVTLPKGCNTGTGDGYLATEDGRWFYGSDGARTLVGCDPSSVPGQSESVHDALRAATNWEVAVTCGADAVVQAILTDSSGGGQLQMTRPTRAGDPLQPSCCTPPTS